MRSTLKMMLVVLLAVLVAPIVQGAEKPKDATKWKPLFDGKTLDGWEEPFYPPEGWCEVKDGTIRISMGNDVAGLRYKKEFPKQDYEIRYQAKRGEGHDFFGALTFPYRNSHCTFVNGGWGGGTIGLSSINGADASENETGAYYSFKEKTWYEFRVRVTEHKIVVWIREIPGEKPAVQTSDKNREKPVDPEKPVVDFVIDGREISLRLESEVFKPLGIGTWCTQGFVRKIEYRMLTPEEIEQSKKEAERYLNRFRE